VVFLFTLTLFVSASLLFAVQPMFAKMVLPILGGAPAVWNTCMVFFQAALFAGYLYAHLSVRWLGARRQAAVHLVIMAAALGVLPVAVSSLWTPPAVENPSLWLLGRMLLSVGPPFFVVAASAPLLQRWFASTSHPDARDPYFLYSASNLGSIFALLAYPLGVEPWLRLRTQSSAWSYGYGALIALVAACAIALWRAPRALEAPAAPEFAAPELPRNDEPAPAAVPAADVWRRRFWWMALAAVPSSLMLSVTTYISTDIAAIPLMWIVPLLLYLLTFVFAFARRQWLSPRLTAALLPAFVYLPVLLMVAEVKTPAWAIIPAHLVAFFVAALVCHQQLVRLRPATRDLTEFYLWMSAGGVVGGIFNALVAPEIFTSPAEYPLGLVLACLLRPAPDDAHARVNRFEVLTAIGLGLFAIPLSELAHALLPNLATMASRAIIYGIPLLGAAFMCRNPVRFSLALGTLLLSNSFLIGLENRVLYEHRNFFGISRVLDDPGANYRYLVNGGTLHGMQALEPARAGEPLSYYNRSGPVGQLFDSFPDPETKRRIAAIGLGSGSMACYGSPGQQWTFYEINPAVVHVARDTGHFTFLSTCLPSASFVMGDARLTLGKATGTFDLIILDAFSSDAIPMHLITQEALALYLRKLSPGGLLFFHITNRHLDLAPVLGDLAQDAGLTAIVQSYQPEGDDLIRGGLPSIWVAMARRKEDLGPLGPLGKDARWKTLTGRPNVTPWSDDFSNLITAFKGLH
jgi:hypothetical protein